MDKRYLPSLIIFAKGMMILAIGMLFKFLNKHEEIPLLIIGGALIIISLVVFCIMSLIKPKSK